MKTQHVPHTTAATWSTIHPSRAAHMMLVDNPNDAKIGLIGIPDDLGISLNGGRQGAAQGPNIFRASLARYGTALPANIDWPMVYDAGDIVSSERTQRVSDEDQLHETHRRVTEAVATILDLGLFPVAIGGGHDLTYPYIRAVCKHIGTPLHGVYFDAHLDVRDIVGSGMPFRKLLTEKCASNLHVLGLNPFANSKEHTDWFISHGNIICTSDETIESVLDTWNGPGFASFDMDVLHAASAPGVSAMNPIGVDAHTAAHWCAAVGKDTHIAAFDIMELSPPHDDNGRTSQLAAHLFLSFLVGFSQR